MGKRKACEQGGDAQRSSVPCPPDAEDPGPSAACSGAECEADADLACESEGDPFLHQDPFGHGGAMDQEETREPQRDLGERGCVRPPESDAMLAPAKRGRLSNERSGVKRGADQDSPLAVRPVAKAPRAAVAPPRRPIRRMGGGPEAGLVEPSSKRGCFGVQDLPDILSATRLWTPRILWSSKEASRCACGAVPSLPRHRAS